MGLQISIKNVKSIKEISLNIPLEKGLYAITGEKRYGEKYDCDVRSIVVLSFRYSAIFRKAYRQHFNFL